MSAAGGITLDFAVVLSTPLEAVFYGFSVCMFGTTCIDLFERRSPTGRLNYKMLIAACLLFILSTIHMGIDIHRLVDGFIKHNDTPDGTVLYFSDLGSFTWFFRNLIYTFQTLLGDAIVIYRCYVVWSSIWIVILPMMLWLSTLVTGSGVLWYFAHAHGNTSDIFNTQLSQWISAFFASTLAANTIATALLAIRLWSYERAVAGLRTSGSNVFHLMRVIMDSGAIYSAFLIVILGLYARKSNVQTIMMDITMPVISICFYLIILRISRHEKASRHSHATSSSKMNYPTIGSTSHRDGIRMQNLEVHLTTNVEVEGDSSYKHSDRYMFRGGKDEA